MAITTISYENSNATNALIARWVVQNYKNSVLRVMLHAIPVLEWFNKHHPEKACEFYCNIVYSSIADIMLCCWELNHCVACYFRHLALCYWTPSGEGVSVKLDELRRVCSSEGQSSTTQRNNYIDVSNNNIHDYSGISMSWLWMGSVASQREWRQWLFQAVTDQFYTQWCYCTWVTTSSQMLWPQLAHQH
jgi:hypothetical protein